MSLAVYCAWAPRCIRSHTFGSQGKMLHSKEMMKTRHKPNVMLCSSSKSKQQLSGTCDWAPATQGTSYIMIDKPKHCLNWRRCAHQGYQLETNRHTLVHTLCMNKGNTHTLASQAIPFIRLCFCLPVLHLSLLLWLTKSPYATNQKGLWGCIIWLRQHTNSAASVTRGEQLVQLPVQMWPVPAPLFSLPASLPREVSCAPFPLFHLIMQFAAC